MTELWHVEKDPAPFNRSRAMPLRMTYVLFSVQELDLVNAPTEAGFVVNDEQVGNALAEVGQALPPRRHSRSFSEPNLAGMIAKQQASGQINNDSELRNALQAGMEDESSDASPDYFRVRSPWSADPSSPMNTDLPQ